MKIVSDNIKNALKQPTTQRKGKILVDDNYYEVYNVEYYADTYLDGNVVGNAIASQLDFDLPYMKKFETFKYFDGVWTGSSYEYIDMGTFHVFDEKDEDEFNKHITAFDNLIKFNAPFNDIGGYPKTLFQELQNVCNQAGIELQNMSIVNGNFQVVDNQFVNGESLKTVLKAICQISGTYATIKNDMLVLQLKNQTNEVIDKSQHEPATWKRRTYGINQVVLGMSDVEGEYVLRQDDADIAENGVHKLVINDNPFAYTQTKRDELIDNLFNQVRGFGYIPYEMNFEWLNYLEIGDTVTIDDIETIVLRIDGKSPKSLESFMSAPAIIDSSITYVDNTETVKNQLKRTEIIVDKQNQNIQSVVEQTNEQNKKISQINQKVDTIEQQISGEYGMESEVLGINQVFIEDALKYYPLELKISGYSNTKNLLYPNTFYPSVGYVPLAYKESELLQLTICIDSQNRNNPTENLKEYSIVINESLRSLGTIKDELEISISSEGEITGTITRYLKYTGSQITKLDKPIIETITVPQIELLEHSNYIYIKEQPNYQLYVKYLIYSTMNEFYATKVELKSSIKQTEDSIISQVSKTYSTKDELAEAKSTIKQTTDEISSEVSKKVGNNEIISKINQSAEEVKIKASKITFEGLVTANKNFKILEDGSMEAQNGKFSGTIEASNIKGSTITGTTINTDKDLTVGNNVYIGQTQTPNTLNEKFLYFTENSYIRRLTVGGYENLIYKAGETATIKGGGITALEVWPDFVRIDVPYDNGGTAEALSISQSNFVLRPGSYRTEFSGGGGAFILENRDENLSSTSFIRADSTGIGCSHTPSVVSDKRLKQKIKDIDVDWIDKLNVKEFEYINTPNKKQIGLIAQDYINDDYSKYFLNENKDGYYSITYGNITNALIQYCQELKKEIMNLKRKMEEQLNVN